MSLFETRILPSFREESELSSDGGFPITGALNKELLSVEEPLGFLYPHFFKHMDSAAS